MQRDFILICLMPNVFVEPEPKAMRKTVLKFKEASLRNSKGTFSKLVKYQVKVTQGHNSVSFRSVSVEAIQEMSKPWSTPDYSRTNF